MTELVLLTAVIQADEKGI